MIYLFDVDGTLTEFNGERLFRRVHAWFEVNRPARVALVTNQGGVGLRRWMETDNFGDNPDKYPTEDQVRDRIGKIAAQIQPFVAEPVGMYICFAYQSKRSGKWSPAPDNMMPEWSREWRKPAPGMLIRAILDLEHFYVLDGALMVGDDETDKQAADAANEALRHYVGFQWADEFFGLVQTDDRRYLVRVDYLSESRFCRGHGRLGSREQAWPLCRNHSDALIEKYGRSGYPVALVETSGKRPCMQCRANDWRKFGG